MQYNLTIYVYDARTGNPLPYATVIITSRETGMRIPTSTDASGMVSLTLEEGTYDIAVRVFNYEPKNVTVFLKGNQTVRIPLRMVRLF